MNPCHFRFCSNINEAYDHSCERSPFFYNETIYCPSDVEILCLFVQCLLCAVSAISQPQTSREKALKVIVHVVFQRHSHVLPIYALHCLLEGLLHVHGKHSMVDSSIIAHSTHSLLLSCNTHHQGEPQAEYVEPLYTCARDTCLNLLAADARIMKLFWNSVVQKLKLGRYFDWIF